ncbi:HPr family phosphocarrier protein [Rhizobiales bacterium]|uniref:HPr family phosphocarrier protein n=1 Tax=Hongsoonwoonella zoysiae TaxID=2821844 RepID=UPI00155FE710|nr:HPr family phosphocarrier protein [Hongsoonwoonella zoysiae]NRG19001.1 HPr family phosphocarrier protein [Hongsoonwoonella zoysiae]
MSEAASNIEWITASAMIVDETGLHARPAVKLTKLAKTFEASVEIRSQAQDRWVNAKSPNAVMKLKAAYNTPLLIRASGPDAAAAAEALADLVERNFDA